MRENDTQCPDPTRRRPTFLLLGHGRHGKGSVAKILERDYGLRFRSSSVTAWPLIWPAFHVATGYKYADPSEGHAHRGEHRMLCKRLISLVNTPDKSALSALVLDGAAGYDGMRCCEEYAASKHLFTHVLWVDACGRECADESMSIEFETGMVYIDNNGPECELADVVAKALRPLGIKPLDRL